MAEQPKPQPNPFAWSRPWSFADSAVAKSRVADFSPSRTAERHYERQLKSVAGNIRTVLATSPPADAERLLREYADIVEPWARQSAANMVGAVDRKNAQAWRAMSGRMGRDMRALLNAPGVGAAVAERIEENTRLIKSLAIGAADEVALAVTENMAAGSRADDLARRIEQIGEVSASRARTIARTEVSKASTALTLARAESVGSTGYIWRTARDGDTRESHRAMEGVFVPWDKPPTIDGMTGHAGEFPNCRCYPEPVIPKEDGGVYQPALPTQAQERNSNQQRLLSTWEREAASPVVRHEPGKPLVNVASAQFDARKLTTYALDPTHPTGRHKARNFERMLGVTQEHAGLVEKQVMAWLEHAPAVRGKADAHGERFAVYVPVTGPNGRTVDVMTAWIYDRRGKTIAARPRLINCFIDRSGR